MATIRLFIDHPKPPAIKKRLLIRQAGDVSLHEKVSWESVNIILTTDESLLAMNRTYLQHDYETDVISFGLHEPGKPVVGEIYISLDQARVQAREYKVPVAQEISRLVIHGALHLCGYDDQTISQQEIMRKKEEFYLTKVPD
ncbi:MAG: rRNA maturation RNase YbeY [Bacteroidetes bacterium]|nr:rRNA maturation RNase YbeY [Bacteroidota bacterium]